MKVDLEFASCYVISTDFRDVCGFCLRFENEKYCRCQKHHHQSGGLMWPKLAKMWWNFNYWTLIKSWLKSTLLIEEVNQSNWKYRKLARVWSYMMTLPFLNPVTSRQKAIFLWFFSWRWCVSILWGKLWKKKLPENSWRGTKIWPHTEQTLQFSCPCWSFRGVFRTICLEILKLIFIKKKIRKKLSLSVSKPSFWPP